MINKKPRQQYSIPVRVFDGFNPELPMKRSLGSDTVRAIMEAGGIESADYDPGVSGWILLPVGGLLLGAPSGSFPAGSIPFTAIQAIATDKILGRDTAGSGVIEQLGLGTGLSISGGNLILSFTKAQLDALVSDGNVLYVGDITQYTDEMAQDAVAGIFADTSTIDFTYDDAGNTISAILVQAYRRKSLFDHFADVGNIGTGEDDLYSDTIAAAQLVNNGEKLEAEYGGIFVSSATATREIKIYFGGTLIFDTGALTLSLSSVWTAYVTIIRVSASVVRCMVSFTTEGAALAAYTSYTEVTGLTLANTQVLKITGEAAGVGAATNDIVAKMAVVEWKAAA